MIQISVIIPAYNAEKTLHNTLKSLLLQDIGLNNFEVIIINDGSNDRTESIIDSYNGKLNLIKINQPNSGPGIARNTGIDASHGMHLAFTDADCIPNVDWLSHIVARLTQNENSVIGGKVDCDEIIIYPWKISPAGQQRITANLALSRDVLADTRFDNVFNGMLCEDSDFIFSLEKKGVTYKYFDDVVVNHPPNTIGLKSVIKHAQSRSYEVLFIKIHGRNALQSMHPLYRPIIFNRISIFSIIFVTAIPIFILALYVNFLIPLIVIILITIFFILYGYKFFIRYTHDSRKDISIYDRLKTFYYLLIYNFTYFGARCYGSYKHKRLAI